MKHLKLVLVLPLLFGLAACQPPIDVPTPKLWHASFRENLIRGYSQAKWGANAAVTPDTTLNLAACGDAINPNDLIQDGAGNILFSSPNQGRVVALAAALVAQSGVVNITKDQCEKVTPVVTSSATGLALDTDKSSFFVGTFTGVKYFKKNAASYTEISMGFDTTRKISGLHLAGNRLYAVDYKDFNGTPGEVLVYDLDTNRTTATLRLIFEPGGNDFLLPEGITIAANRLWVANNKEDNLMGFLLSDINATTPGETTTLVPKILTKSNTDSFMRCPGGLATAPNGELWVNVQGASAANANCGSDTTALGNIYKYTIAQLNNPASVSALVPALQFSSIASVPGYGGLFFGK